MPAFKFPWQKGFSLVEIAIVLVVVGLLISGGLLGLAPVLQSNKVSQTNAQMDRIEQALVLYVIQNGCLPCPADPATITGADAGQAGNTGPTYYASGCGSATTCVAPHGLVPWVNLGLSKDDVIDAFGTFIGYVPGVGLNTTSSQMVRTPPSTYPPYAPSTTLTVRDAGSVIQTSEAAYVLISHGADGSYGYTASNGSLRADPNNSTLQSCNSVAQATCPAGFSNAYVQNQAQGVNATNGYFDDIVRFKTAPVIIQSCGSNACGNPA
jgi:prepilin-type N-terminal cleavage/methylation domain-containing protein